MKRIGIISDTHSCYDARFREHFHDCDQIWHAGDVGDWSVLEQLQSFCPVVQAVHGNCDHGDVRRLCPEIITDEIEGVRLFMTHIGGYPGRYQPGLKNLLREQATNLYICGHSHILKVMRDPELGLLHINPGAAGTQGWQLQRTLVKLDLDHGMISNLKVIELGKLMR